MRRFAALLLQPWLVIALFAMPLSAPLVHAQELTPQMIERLKAMPSSQRNALLQQYGVDPSLFSAFEGGRDVRVDTLGAPGQPLEPLEKRDNRSLEELLMALPQQEMEEEVAPEDIRFGLQLFDRDQSSFSMTDDSPVPDDYVLGIGDELQVYMFGKESTTHTVQVDRQGMVAVPGLPSIPLGGLSFEEAKRFLIAQIESSKIGVSASVSMSRLRAVSVYVAGEANQPGTYSVSALSSVTQLLFQAGGVSDIGSLRNIQVRRSGEHIATLDVYELLLSGDARNDIRLQSGDVVFVPPYDKEVKLSGAVKRPGRFELVENETLADLLAMGGGFTANAYKRDVGLVRNDFQAGKTVIELELATQPAATYQLLDGDEVMVRESSSELASAVFIEGAVARPGHYGWTEGLRVSDVLGEVTRDYLQVADLNYAMVVRTVNRLRDIGVVPFKPIEATLNPNTEADPILMPQDRILIFRIPTLELEDTTVSETSVADEQSLRDLGAPQRKTPEEQRLEEELEVGDRTKLLEPVIAKLRDQASPESPAAVVSISGAVRVAGEYPLVNGSSIDDLIAAAGGLRDEAFLDSAELRRLRVAADGTMTFAYETINLRAADALSSRKLSSRDHLTVRAIPDWNPSAIVTVSGQVRFPGQYRLERGERLADLVRRAGGFSENAFPEGAVLTRTSVAENERKRAQELASTIRQSVAASLLTEEVQSISLAEISELTKELATFEGQGRLLIDIPAAMGGNDLANIRLLDGDELVIPQDLSNVTVVGEVKRQGTHSFQAGYDIQDYLGLSAGLTARADAAGLYVVRANGSVEIVEQSLLRFTKRNIDLRPGDTIVVPVNSRYKESLVAWREITQIIYQGAVSIAAVVAL